MNQTTTAQPSLTDAECDAILRTQVSCDTDNISTIGITLYRASQYADYDQADHCGATTKIPESYSLLAAEDTIFAMERIANLLDHCSDENDVRAVIHVNSVKLPECYLADAVQQIKRHIVRMGWYVR